ncbi:MAG: hypothetical protein AABY86_16610 [Bdellovibrionota bacterium]
MIKKSVSFIFPVFCLLFGSAHLCLAQTVRTPHDIGIPQQADEDWPIDLELYDQNDQNKSVSTTNLDDIDFTSIDELKKHEKYFVPTIKIENEKRGGFRWPTEIYRAVLRDHAIVYDLHTKKGSIVYRKAFVFAQEETAGGETIYIYDKTKQKRYKTNSINVISIEEDLNLQSIPSVYKEYAPPTQYHSKDTRLSLDNYLNFHGEYMRDQYLADLFTSLLPAGTTLSSNTFYAYGKRLEYKSFYVWDFPIQFGINLNYQEGNWLGDAEGLIWRSAFFGPVAQYTFYQNETVRWNVHVSFQQSFFFKATSSSQNFAFTYSTNAMEVNLNSIWSTSYGRIVIGAGLRQANASLEKTTVELRRDSERGTMDSASFLLGYNFDWNIGG